MVISPIVLFVYNRPWHTRQTIEALQANALADESILYIYSDAPKDPHQADNVAETRKYISTVKGFAQVEIIEREHNLGLAENIISGVSEVIEKHRKVIVLEDDIVSSPAFLTFMNTALDYYESNRKVGHISGWNYPLDAEGLGDIFFWRVMNCWGWATWADRWKYFEKDPAALISSFSKSDISRFDLDDSGIFWKQVTDNASGAANTWAIFWYAALFRQNTLCLNPAVSYINNIGHDGSGENCAISRDAAPGKLNNTLPSFTDDIAESGIAVSKIKDYYRRARKHPLAAFTNTLRRYANRLIR